MNNAISNATEYVGKHGRPLEKALLSYHLGKGNSDEITNALESYLNKDGGFGKALEADFRASESSVLCTTFAMDILIEIGMPSDHHLVQSGANYLKETYNQEMKSWRLIPELEESYPRAPWWNQDKLAETFNNFTENPRVKILGYMYQYPELFSYELQSELTVLVLDYLKNRSLEISVDSLYCYLSLLDSKNLPINMERTIYRSLVEMIPVSVEKAREKWGQYGMKPLDVIRRNDSPFISLMPNLVEQNIEYYLDTQISDGSWTPPWIWNNDDDINWNYAKRDWTGIVTLERMKKLEWFL